MSRTLHESLTEEQQAARGVLIARAKAAIDVEDLEELHLLVRTSQPSEDTYGEWIKSFIEFSLFHRFQRTPLF